MGLATSRCVHRWLALQLLFVSALAHGHGTPRTDSISLRDAVARAVKHSPALAQSGAELTIAEGQIEKARGLDDLLLDVSLSWLELRRQLVLGAPVQQPAFDDLLAAVSLTQPLPTGGRIGLRLSSEYSRTEYATSLGMDLGMDMSAEGRRSIAEAVAPALQVVFVHPLLRGFGPKVARAERRRTQAAWDVARLFRAAAVATHLRDLTSMYWDLYYAAQELHIRQSAAESAREQLRRVSAQIEVGKQPPSAAAEVEVAIALRDEAALLAEQTVLERSIELERLMGQPASAERWLKAADEPQPEPEFLTPSVAMSDALERSPQLA